MNTKFSYIALVLLVFVVIIFGVLNLVCVKPYLRHAFECCLDENDNKICDKDEQLNQLREKQAVTKRPPIIEDKQPDGNVAWNESAEEQQKCSDECSSDICNGFEYVSCLRKEDGCYDQVNEGSIKEKCGVECLYVKDCEEDQKCVNYKCVCDNECASDSCVDYYSSECIINTNGCRERSYRGIVTGKCGVECKQNSDCIIGKVCSLYKCEYICDDETEIFKNGKCESCGEIGEQCCTEDSCILPDSTCTNNICESCGKSYEKCCSGSRCTCDRDGGLPCTCSNNICEPESCGMTDQKCCPGNSCIFPGLNCVNGICTMPESCGSVDEKCCSGNTCNCGSFFCKCIGGMCREI